MSRIGELGGRLYRGEVSFDFVGRQRLWYAISGVILVVSIAALALRGLNLGVEFQGGTVFQFTAPTASTSEVRSAVLGAAGTQEAVVQQLANGRWRVQTPSLDATHVTAVQQAVAQHFDLRSPNDVSPQSVSASWGAEISKKALYGLVVFIVLVVLYLSLAFEWKMAVSAIVALAHDIVITVGIYALVGFEVTPASVVGLLTILGYSLYDTVVVFDKVRENTRGLLGGGRMSYSGAANLAVNQTLVRSINTTVMALLPVAAILFVGAGLLGAGTLKDLALVLFVGMLAGTYSSIFIATPLLADLKEREPKYRGLARRVAQRETATAKKRVTAEAPPADATAQEPGEEPEDSAQPPRVGTTSSRPRLVQQGPRQQPRRGGSKRRPSGKKRR